MTNGNDAAFSRPTIYGPDEDHPSMVGLYESGADGLTKREYFAAMATNFLPIDPEGYGRLDLEGLAKDCVVFADALIAALNEEPK
jgi:hypothetical protein